MGQDDFALAEGLELGLSHALQGVPLIYAELILEDTFLW